jgi:hypothetical protein
MIYVLDIDPEEFALWVTYTRDCVEWRIEMLQRTAYESPPADEKRIRALDAQIRQSAPTLPTDELWSDALALWRRLPEGWQGDILNSLSAKFAAVPEALGLFGAPRHSVFLPNTAYVLAIAVADVARDTEVLWLFRAKHLGENAEPTRLAFKWRYAAFSLAALFNRVEHMLKESRLEYTWTAYRLQGPDIPELELVPSLP